MRRKILFLSVAVLAFVSSVFLTYAFYYESAGRLDSKTEIKIKNSEIAIAPQIPEASNSEPLEIKLNEDIRQIDFKNFTYDWFPKNDYVSKKRIALSDGRNKVIHLEGERYGPLGQDYHEHLRNVSYADLTGDGKEEAIVTVGVSFYRWTPMCIFIFSEKNKKAIQIWKYETSAYDSNLQFRGLKAEGGKLVIEEFEESMAACCAKNLLRKTAAWTGKTFEMEGLQSSPWNNRTKDFTGFPSEKY